MYNIYRCGDCRRQSCESGGTGRRARLRGVWLHRTGSSPVSRTKKHTSVCFFFLPLSQKPAAARKSSRAGGACTPCSRFMHLKVKSSPETVIFIANCRGGYYPPAGTVRQRRKQKIPRREDFFAAGGYSPVFSQKYLLLVYYHAFIVPSASIGFQLVTQTLPLL